MRSSPPTSSCAGWRTGADRRHRLVEQRQIEILMSTSSNSRRYAFGEIVDPLRHGFAFAARPRASDDDGNFEHK